MAVEGQGGSNQAAESRTVNSTLQWAMKKLYLDRVGIDRFDLQGVVEIEGSERCCPSREAIQAVRADGVLALMNRVVGGCRESRAILRFLVQERLRTWAP